MTEPRRSLAEWASLRSGPATADALEIPTVPALVVTQDGPVRYALGDRGEPRVLLPLKGPQPLPRMQISDALSVELRSYHLGQRKLWFLDLQCLVPALEGVFGEVVDEMLARVVRGDSCVEACRRTLSDFRALLVQPVDRAFPDHVILGLAGELMVVRDLVRLDADGWKAWRGPLGERHDFRGGSFALEVKTSARTAQQKVRITSIDQLAAPVDGELHLLHQILEVSDGAALTVGRLSEEIEAAASDPLEFRNRLAALDCPDPSADGWNRLAFSDEGQALFLVEEGFPRLTVGELLNGAPPLGISGLEYDIDLAAAERFLVDAKDNSLVLERMISCLRPD